MPRRIPGLLIAVNVAISVSRAADLADATALLGLVRIASEVGMLQGEVGKGAGLAPALPGPRVNPRSLYRKSPQIRFAVLAVSGRLMLSGRPLGPWACSGPPSHLQSPRP